MEQKAGETWLSRKLKNWWAYFFRKQSIPAFFMVGMINGLLPCGLVYAALAGAIAGGSALNGGLFMLAFGLGTTPGLLLAGVLKKVFQRKLQQWRSFFLPTSLAMMALLFILRGASLGIPYLSPEINQQTGETSCGCEK